MAIVDLRERRPDWGLRQAVDLPLSPRLVLVDTASAALGARHGELTALLAEREVGSVLLVLVEPAATRTPDQSRDHPSDHTVEADDQPDLDAHYDPDLYAFLEVGPDELITSGPPAASPAATRTDTPRVDPAPTHPVAAATTQPDATQPVTTRPDTAPADHCATGGDDALLTMLDGLRAPEVFDRFHRAASAVPGRLVLPGIGAVVHQLPEQPPHDVRQHAAGRPGLARRVPRNRLRRLYPLLPARIRRFAPLPAGGADLGGGVGPAGEAGDDRPDHDPTRCR
ncbi:hypothetical protein [Frankia sp. R82]|uniref:hypothetical protein n=1 Tax=Frankia sp. R82 TaxID=2950553 RepID=UPI0020447CC3|nr:hypothetical protein [Frankia sp. R82]MCM3884510.1 hypothetical protein [Frankia sp. R82]